MTADPVAGLAYLPVESPTSDFYGGKRPGNNLYANSLVAVDLKTGKMKWYFQFIHHEIWDYDMSSAPLLMDINVDGKPIKAVAEPTKMGMLYVFDRITGKPVWPIPEQKVEKGNVPGEWYSPTQPIPTKPSAYARTGTVDGRSDRLHARSCIRGAGSGQELQAGPDLHSAGAVETARARSAPSCWARHRRHQLAGRLLQSGKSHRLCLCLQFLSVSATGLVPPPPGFTDLPYVEGQAGQPVVMVNAAGADAGRRCRACRPSRHAAAGRRRRRFPASDGSRPAADQAALRHHQRHQSRYGDIVWQVAHGETPDYIRNSPALKGLNIPRTGQTGFNIGTLVTKTLVIAGDAQVTTTPDHPRGAMLRAYDQNTGKDVGDVLMPAGQSGSPMTYMVNGKQYIIVAV